MSIPVRRSGRIAFAAPIVIALMAALVGVRLVVLAEGEEPPATIDAGPLVHQIKTNVSSRPRSREWNRRDAIDSEGRLYVNGGKS